MTSGLILWSISLSLNRGDDLIDKSISAEGIPSTSCDASFVSEMPLLPSNFVGGDLRFDDIIWKTSETLCYFKGIPAQFTVSF